MLKADFVKLLICLLRPERSGQDDPDEDNLKLHEKYDIFRKYIQHEDYLINNRMTWMLSIHGFLYAIYGLTLQKTIDVAEKVSEFIANPSNADRIDCYINGFVLSASYNELFWFLWVVCAVGCVISASAFFLCRARIWQQMLLPLFLMQEINRLRPNTMLRRHS